MGNLFEQALDYFNRIPVGKEKSRAKSILLKVGSVEQAFYAAGVKE